MVYPERRRTVVSFDHVGAAVVNRVLEAQALLAGRAWRAGAILSVWNRSQVVCGFCLIWHDGSTGACLEWECKICVAFSALLGSAQTYL